MLLLLCIALLVSATAGFSTGAPSAACDNLRPQHVFLPSTDPIPYEIKTDIFTDGCYKPDETYTVSVLPNQASSHPSFRGFLVQGRSSADDSPAGEFQAGSNYQPRCIDDTAATHTSSVDKSDVELKWKSPPEGTGCVYFRFSVVQAFHIYWAGHATSPFCECPAATEPNVTTPTPVVTEEMSGDSSTNETSSGGGSTDEQPTDAPTPVTCDNSTEYPLCSEELCTVSRGARCLTSVETCDGQCQVIFCRMCDYYTGEPRPQESCKDTCKRLDLPCIRQWWKCARDVIEPMKAKQSEQTSETFQCFAPACSL